MKLSCMLVSVLTVVGARLLEEAELFGSAFSSPRFDAVGSIGDEVGGDPGEQSVNESVAFAIGCASGER